jgi:hypothetical protein
MMIAGNISAMLKAGTASGSEKGKAELIGLSFAGQL